MRLPLLAPDERIRLPLGGPEDRTREGTRAGAGRVRLPPAPPEERTPAPDRPDERGVIRGRGIETPPRPTDPRPTDGAELPEEPPRRTVPEAPPPPEAPPRTLGAGAEGRLRSTGRSPPRERVDGAAWSRPSPPRREGWRRTGSRVGRRPGPAGRPPGPSPPLGRSVGPLGRAVRPSSPPGRSVGRAGPPSSRAGPSVGRPEGLAASPSPVDRRGGRIWGRTGRADRSPRSEVGRRRTGSRSPSPRLTITGPPVSPRARSLKTKRGWRGTGGRTKTTRVPRYR